MKPIHELDRLFWCEACRRRGLARSARIGWTVGVGLTTLLVLWIWLVVRPDRDFILAGWIACVVAVFYLAGRIARELGYGVMRLRNRRAAEAMPPTDE